MAGEIDINLFQHLLENMGVGVVFVDRQGIVRYCNAGFENLKHVEAGKIIGRSVYRCHPEGLKSKVEHIIKDMKKGKLGHWQKIAVDGEPLLENRVTAVQDEDGTFVGTMLTVHDISLHKELLEHLRKSQRELSALYKASQAMNSSLNINDALFQILLLAQEVINFTAGTIYLFDEEKEELTPAASMDCLLEGPPPTVIDYCSPDNVIACAVRSGQIITLRRGQQQFYDMEHRPNSNVIIILPLRKQDTMLGALVVESETESIFEMDQQGILMTFANQAAVSIHNAQLFTRTRQMAILDGLTKLYNRQYFDHLLNNAIAHAKRKKTSLAIMMIDVNDLKHINDYHGHLLGDYIIQAAADVLRESVREADTVCRFGGDEMVILMPDTTDKDVRHVYKRIIERVGKWNERDNQYPGVLKMSLSIGWAAGRGPDGLHDLLSTADRKMYEDKRQYKLKRKAEDPGYNDDRGDIG
ncbi:MAG: diguanylate cyclase domain-containing protein [Bacillota bacterium]